MRDEDKTKEQLLSELRELRRHVAAVEMVNVVGEPTGAYQKESADTFRLLYEEAPLPYQSLDENGNLIEVNKAWLDTLGYNKEEVIGKNFGDFLHSDRVERFKENFQRFKALGKVHGVEFEMVRKDGLTVLVSLTGRIGRDDHGNFRQTHCIFQDITQRREAEQATEAAYLRHRSLVETAMDGFWLADLQGNLIEVNETYCRMSGYSEQELLTMKINDVEALETPVDTADRIRKIIFAGEDRFESRHKRKDGYVFDVEVSVKYRAEEGGQLVVFLRDITDRKLAEEALREREELFRNVFEHHSAVKLIIDPDTGNIQNANKAAQSFYGWSEEQLKRMSMLDINTLPAKEVSLQMDKAIRREQVRFEFRHRRADGSIRDVEVFSGIIVVNEKTLLHSIVHDVTERKEAERLLRESEERYRQLFDNIKDAVYVYLGTAERMPGRIIEVNEVACKSLGYTREEFLQMSPPDIDTPDTLANLPRVMEELYQNGQTMWEGAHMTKDGQRIPVEISNRLFDFRGVPMILATARDLSERKKAEEEKEELQAQLNHAQKMESVGRLAGGVAHGFNNMLGVILGHAEMAMGQIDETNQLFADLTEITKAAERSTELTRQLLAFARRQTISPKILDLNETVEGMLKMLRRLIGEDIDLAWLPAKSLWPVKVDPSQLDQVLANLCVNARDAISGIGKVTIETGTTCFDSDYCARHPEFVPGEFVMLAVSDDGCGMDKETVSKIFEPFYTTKNMGEGTGLGLATVYGIVRQNNGFINVYSEPGQGTTFKLYIPRAEEQKTEKPPVHSNQDLRGKETVLLVEDEEPMLALGKTILQRYGYEVLATKSPTEALAMAQNHAGPLHLLITDVVMPEMNGRDLRDRLAEIKPGFKTIFMSGYTANVIAHHGILDEGINFLQKPFSLQTILEKIRLVLDG